MRTTRGVWVGTVFLAAAAACSTGDTTTFTPEEGGAPHYDSGAADGTGGSSGAGGDGATGAGGDSSAHDAPAGDAASGATDAGQDGSPAEASAEAGADAAGSDAGHDAAAEGGADAGADAAPEAGVEAGPEAATGPDAAPEAGAVEAGPEAGADAPAEAADAAQDAAPDAPSIVAPTCDGVIGAGEYGGASYQLATGTGQTWYVTWDDVNLYVAISSANIDEGDILYLAVDPGGSGGPAGGSTSGRLYDSTDITTLPFAGQLVAYAHDGYTEARTASGGAWGSPDTTSVRLCDNGTTSAREEVIPWALVGGRPASFGWFGYLAANGNQNPNGYIYGQVPQDDPGGGPANNDTYTHYFFVPDATPTVGTPFTHEH
jgi:hypothetical protein